MTTEESTTNTNTSNNQSAKKQRKCSKCGQVGHTKRKCPLNAQIDTPNNTNTEPTDTNTEPTATTNSSPTTPSVSEDQLNKQELNEIRSNNVIYFPFDLETTGRSTKNDKICEIFFDIPKISVSNIFT